MSEAIQRLAKLLEESGAEMVFRHSDVHVAFKDLQEQLAAEQAKVALADVAFRNICSVTDSMSCSEPCPGCTIAVLAVDALAALQSSDALADIRREVARECAEIVKAGRIDPSERTLAMLRKLASLNAKLCLDTIVEEVGYCGALAIRAKFGVTE